MHTVKKNVKPCIITLIASELCGTREKKNTLNDWIKLTKKKIVYHNLNNTAIVRADNWQLTLHIQFN